MRGDTARRALRKIDSLAIDPSPSTGRAGLMLSTNPAYGAPSPAVLELWAVGFQAKRWLDRDELEAIRDWCSAALVAIDAPDVAEAERMEA